MRLQGNLILSSLMGGENMQEISDSDCSPEYRSIQSAYTNYMHSKHLRLQKERSFLQERSLFYDR